MKTTLRRIIPVVFLAATPVRTAIIALKEKRIVRVHPNIGEVATLVDIKAIRQELKLTQPKPQVVI